MSTQYRVILIVKVKMLWLELVPNLPLLYLVGFGSSILVLVAKVACEMNIILVLSFQYLLLTWFGNIIWVVGFLGRI